MITLFIATLTIAGLISLHAGQAKHERSHEQREILQDLEVHTLKPKIQLFMYDGCPYCVRVTAFLEQYKLLDKVEFIDAGLSSHKDLLQKISGRTQAPYLVDLDAGVKMPESLDIIAYLTQKFKVKQHTPVAVPIAYQVEEINGLKKYNSATFLADVQKSVKPVILLISTTWCPPCKILKPIFQNVAEQMSESCDFIILDGDLNGEIVSQLLVRAYPTVICYKNGKRFDPQHYRTQVDLEKIVAQLI